MQIAPYVSERRMRRQKIRRYMFGVLAVFALYFAFLGAVLFLVRGPLFRVNNVVVTGAPGIANADVIALVEADPSGHFATGWTGAVLGWRNMLAWPGAVPSSTLLLAPELSGIGISKDYFSHTVTIAVSERQPFGIWCFMPKGAAPLAAPASASSSSSSPSAMPAAAAQGQCYWFDDAGVLFEKAMSTQGNIIFVVNDYSQSDRGLGNTVLPVDFNTNLISVMNVLRAAGLGVREMDLRDLSLEEVDAQTTAGPVIEFSLRFPADDYLPVLKQLAAQSGFDKLQYIDCRTQDRVFYK